MASMPPRKLMPAPAKAMPVAPPKRVMPAPVAPAVPKMKVPTKPGRVIGY